MVKIRNPFLRRLVEERAILVHLLLNDGLLEGTDEELWFSRRPQGLCTGVLVGKFTLGGVHPSW